MAQAPLRKCCEVGCNRLVRKTRCDEHTRTFYEKNRPSAAKQGYDRRWRKAREIFLQSNPLCVVCLTASRTKAANVVDHVKPHRGDMDLFWDVLNWQSLCESCHSKKTRRGE